MYPKIGSLFAMAFVHRGGALRLFSPSVFSYMCGMSASDIIVDTNEVSDPLVKAVLEKVLLLY